MLPDKKLRSSGAVSKQLLKRRGAILLIQPKESRNYQRRLRTSREDHRNLSPFKDSSRNITTAGTSVEMLSLLGR